MILEIRDEATRSLSFVQLPLLLADNARPIAKNPGIGWYGAIAGIQDQMIVFHLDRAENSPVFKGVAAGNLDQLLWENKENTFQHFIEHGIVVSDVAGNQSVLDIFTGKQIASQNISRVVDEVDNRSFPEHYPEGHPFFEEVGNFINKSVKVSLSHGVDYLEWKELILVAFYEKTNSGFSHHLLVFDQSGSIVDKFILATQRQGIGRDAFFVTNHYLFMVAEQSSFLVYKT